MIILTARDDLDDKIEGLDAGGDDYVTKPFKLEESLARGARAPARRPAPANSSLLEAGEPQPRPAHPSRDASGPS